MLFSSESHTMSYLFLIPYVVVVCAAAFLVGLSKQKKKRRDSQRIEQNRN